MSMTLDKIREALLSLFNTEPPNRVVFWKDESGEFEEAFAELELPDCEKIMRDENEFVLKYRILKEEPDKRFLIYSKGAPVDDAENWLLDLELASPVFSASRENIICSELGLSTAFLDVIREHLPFFKSDKRKKTLKAALGSEETVQGLKQKMLMICCDELPATTDVEKALLRLLDEQSRGGHTRYELMERCDLKAFFWDQFRSRFNYTDSVPSIEDFTLFFFESLFKFAVEDGPCTQDLLVFANTWKDSVSNRASYVHFADELSDYLFHDWECGIDDYSSLEFYDYFRGFERSIVCSLAMNATSHFLSVEAVTQLISRRKTSLWFDGFENDYLAILAAVEFFHTFESLTPQLYAADAFLQAYTDSWYLCDYYYRKFMSHYAVATCSEQLKEMHDEIEGVYANDFLYDFNNAFQRELSKKDEWGFTALDPQRDFYKRYVVDTSGRRRKVAVIISDGLRYEVCHELQSMIQSENRYSAQLDALYTALPSNTKNGMAALLPHETLEWHRTGSDKVSVLLDGLSTDGMENRQRILQRENPQSLCFRPETVLTQTIAQLREATRSTEVLYCYHNVIDDTGDSRASEHDTFNACDRTVHEVFELIRKFANANFNHFIVTADHGFLYTQGDVATSDFTQSPVNGETLLDKNPRYVMGRHLETNDSFMHFGAAQVGVKGELEVLIPKSVNRIGRGGIGYRYVHGGASLQEIIVPVLTVTKTRDDDVATVDVSILSNASNIISTGTLSLTLYQNQPCSEKLHPRQLKIALYTVDDDLVSDIQEILFDAKTETVKEREHLVDLRLTSKASDYNGQTLYLKLTEPYGNTGKFVEYKRKAYELRMTFGLDF